MSKIIIELKVVEVKETTGTDYNKTKSTEVEENRIKLEVESFDKAEAKVIAFFKMLGI